MVTRMVKYIRKGDKGEQGAVLRGPQAWSDCATGYPFQSGAAGEDWKDVVLYNNKYYACKKAHAKTSANYPGSTTDVNNGLWRLGDSIELVATKILLATYALVENLGVTAIDMKDAKGNVVFQAKNGNVTCKIGTFENVVVSGTLNGVTGSFRTLNCVDSNGNEVGAISFGSDGKMWFSGDMYHQGYNSAAARGHRFYTSDLWCRGQFGAAERNVLVVHGSYGYYYPKGVSDTGVYVAFPYNVSSNSVGYYTLPLYGTNGDYAGMPVDTVVFKITSDTHNYLLSMGNSQRVLVINANDRQNNARIFINGNLRTWNGGVMAEVCKMHTFQNPQQSSAVLGAGMFIGGMNDENW